MDLREQILTELVETELKYANDLTNFKRHCVDVIQTEGGLSEEDSHRLFSCFASIADFHKIFYAELKDSTK